MPKYTRLGRPRFRDHRINITDFIHIRFVTFRLHQFLKALCAKLLMVAVGRNLNQLQLLVDRVPLVCFHKRSSLKVHFAFPDSFYRQIHIHPI